MAIIAGQLSYATDEAGNTMQTAADVTYSSATTFAVQGVIETRTDVDWLRIVVHGPGTLTLQATSWTSPVYTWGSNLDISLTLVDSLGATLAQANPSGAVPAIIAHRVTPGVYYAVHRD